MFQFRTYKFLCQAVRRLFLLLAINVAMVFKVVVIEERDDTKQLRSFSHFSCVCTEGSLRLVFYLTVWVSSFYLNKSPLLAYNIIFRPHLSSATPRPVPNTPLFSTSSSAYLTVENMYCVMICAFCRLQDSYVLSFVRFCQWYIIRTYL
jgi:hypothetical protein